MKLFVFIVDTCGIQVKVGSTVKAPVDLLLSRLPHIDERKKNAGSPASSLEHLSNNDNVKEAAGRYTGSNRCRHRTIYPGPE